MSLNHLDMNPTAAPCVMVIFGATGDLTKRKLIPALCNLAQDEVLPKQFAIVGFASNDFDTTSFRKMLSEEIPKYVSTPIDPKLWDWMSERIYYVKGDFVDPEAYKRLDQQINEADKRHNTLGNRFFYLAVAPRFFSPIAQMLGQCCLTKEESGHWARVIIEKPFGHDLESAKKLNQELNQVLTEKQIYRIDHYLGKETVQTSWSSAFPTTSSSRSGIATTLTTCKSPRPKPSASSTAAAFTRRLARFATWCPITFSSF